MSRVILLRPWHPPCYTQGSTRLATALPYFEREGDGYVHIIRCGDMHRSRKDDRHTHTSFGFWCGGHGFILPPGVNRSRRGGFKSAQLRAEPSPGRVVCATCIGRSIGAGQLQPSQRVNGKPVKFRPHAPFMTGIAL